MRDRGVVRSGNETFLRSRPSTHSSRTQLPGEQVKRVVSTLRSDRGSSLVDVMLGIFMVAIVMIGLATGVAASSTAVKTYAFSNERLTFIRSVVSDLAQNPGSVAATATPVTMTYGSEPIIVTEWSVVTGASAVIHAATSRTSAVNGGQCTDPNSIPASCVEAQATVSLADSAVAVAYLTPAWASTGVATAAGATANVGKMATLTVPTADTEVRYIVHVAGAGSAGSIQFMNGASVLRPIPFDSTTNGYIYGSVTTNGATTVDISLAGSAANVAHFTLYEAPK